MNKKLSLSFFSAILVICSIVLTALPSSSNAVDASTNVVVYFVPHADDEVLSYGVPILNDMRAGKKVYLVLLSPGEDSQARVVVNGKTDEEVPPPIKTVYCNWHKKYHNPVTENYQDTHLTKIEFGQARIKEFLKVGKELGIPSTQLKTSIIPNDIFTYNSVKSIVLSYDRLFPNASFKGFSSVDYHPDHAMVGKVLNDLYKSKQINKPTTILSILTDRHINTTYTVQVPGYKVYLTNSADKTKIVNSINRVYKAWDPTNGVYGLGYHSVPQQFDAIVNDTYSKITSY